MSSLSQFRSSRHKPATSPSGNRRSPKASGWHGRGCRAPNHAGAGDQSLYSGQADRLEVLRAGTGAGHRCRSDAGRTPSACGRMPEERTERTGTGRDRDTAPPRFPLCARNASTSSRKRRRKNDSARPASSRISQLPALTADGAGIIRAHRAGRRRNRQAGLQMVRSWVVVLETPRKCSQFVAVWRNSFRDHWRDCARWRRAAHEPTISGRLNGWQANRLTLVMRFVRNY